MSSAKTLTATEVMLIKGMLKHRPDMTKQSILSYFSRPGRDINHRVIAQIAAGSLWLTEATASSADTHAFMVASEGVRRPLAKISESGSFSIRPTRDVVPLLLDWWPVGQGLFASGAILRESGPAFNWVFDCGSSSAVSVINNAIDLHKSFMERFRLKEINIVAISHFDKDHINGFEALLKGKIVKIVLLPFVPLWQRIVIALEQGVDANSRVFDYFVDPAGYILSLEGGKDLRIIFVRSTDSEDPVPALPEVPDGGPFDAGEGDLKIDYGEIPEEAHDDPVISKEYGENVRFLRKAGRIVVPYFWEFVPYNDAKTSTKVMSTFLLSIKTAIDEFFEDGKKNSALAKLRKLYDAEFGSRPGPRNIISLFLYSGPIGSPCRLSNFSSSHLTGLEIGDERFCQMHTGDGSLKTKNQLKTFERFYNPGDRLKRCGIFQVMHHGAEGSWQKDFANRVKPAVSIYSSDPNGSYGHPHAEVVRDFWTFFGIQVDTHHRFRFTGNIFFPKK